MCLRTQSSFCCWIKAWICFTWRMLLVLFMWGIPTWISPYCLLFSWNSLSSIWRLVLITALVFNMGTWLWTKVPLLPSLFPSLSRVCDNLPRVFMKEICHAAWYGFTVTWSSQPKHFKNACLVMKLQKRASSAHEVFSYGHLMSSYICVIFPFFWCFCLVTGAIFLNT